MMATYYRFRSITSTPIPTVFPTPDDVNQKTVHDPETGEEIIATRVYDKPENLALVMVTYYITELWVDECGRYYDEMGDLIEM